MGQQDKGATMTSYEKRMFAQDRLGELVNAVARAKGAGLIDCAGHERLTNLIRRAWLGYVRGLYTTH